MPRRSRPCCIAARPLPGAVFFLIIAGISTAFVQIKHCRSGAPSSSATSAAWSTADNQGWNHRGIGAADGWRRRPRADQILRMVAQQETPSAAKLAAGAAAGTAVAKPFMSRKLGSFEKMLTQTRDGVGPAEEGIRNLLTPHVWVSVWSPTLVVAVVAVAQRRKESVRPAVRHCCCVHVPVAGVKGGVWTCVY